MTEATIRLATANELNSVVQFYRSTGYGGGVDLRDEILVALLGGELLGARARRYRSEGDAICPMFWPGV